MFGGIIEAIGQVRSCESVAGGKTLVVTAGDFWTGAATGASVAVDGVCLTLTRADGGRAAFDVVSETLRCSTLGDLRSGDRVNLQKSLVVGERVDGHFVQGHVDAVGRVAKVERSARESKWWFSMDSGVMAYLIPKGSVAVDGISLTIADVREGLFSTALIPTTLERTTLGQKDAGARVNIETDILARTVVDYLRSMGGERGSIAESVTLEQLKRQGFA